MAEQRKSDSTADQSRVALVMAASRGLGRGCAEALAEAGHRLVVCSRDRSSIEETVSELKHFGTEVVGQAADVSDPAQLEGVFQLADNTFGRLDILVSNAGGPPAGAFSGVSDTQWHTAFELTLMSAVRSIHLALKPMRRDRFGRIIVIGSSSVKQPIPGLVLSNAFRPALIGMTKTVSQEVARDGITVNMVSPGRIDTDRVRTLDESRAKAQGIDYAQFRASFEESIPAGRYGTPRDVGTLVRFLASDDAGYITGQSIIVDGGMVSALP